SFLSERPVDMLTREFLDACRALNNSIILPSCVKHSNDDILINEHTLIELHEHIDDIDSHFFSKGLTIFDNAYIKYLPCLGKKGKEEAKKTRGDLRNYPAGWDPTFWLMESPDDNELKSPALLVLAYCLWEDIVKRKVNFSRLYVPAVSTSVQIPICRLLSPKAKVIENDHQLQIVDKSDLVGSIKIPTIAPHLLRAVKDGSYKLSSVYSHRLFRFEVQEPFRKKAAGDDDCRVIRLDGGRTELAERLGFKGKKAITTLGEILAAQAHFEFTMKGISGNLIQLTRYISPVTKREEGLEITVGTMLLPYHCFDAYNKGECGLLIPLVKDPPLVGAHCFHANLYSLQMDVMAAFSDQSIELSTTGCIKISQRLWEELCIKNGIPPSLAQLVHDRWISDGDDQPKFLQMIQKEHYTLGNEYAKELEFLKEQGNRRLQASNAGKLSSIAKKKKGNRRK
ncbi:MAG: hypothetical protein JSR46_08895, partial [Verrucomicrobia bacterium]|nr:hypothetical protein [Verrucomicrobiota bacterium]